MRSLIAEILIQHQRMDIGSCRCGWGVETGDIGRSHSAHVTDEVLPVIAAHLRGVMGDEPFSDDHLGMFRAAEIIESRD